MNKKVGLVIGGASQLGNSIIQNFQKSWSMTSLDFKTNENSDKNIILDGNQKIQSQLIDIYKQIEEQDKNYDSIIFVGGVEYKDNAKEKNILENYQKQVNSMLFPALLATHLSTKYLQENGLIVLQGCYKQASLSRNENLTYSIAKNSIMSMVSNAAKDEQMLNKTVIALLTEDVDTAEGREAQIKADYTNWISCDNIAGLLKIWSEGLNRPQSGSYAILKNNDQKLANPTFIK